MKAAKNKKKQNIFAAYFSSFGLRQVCDLLMLTGAIVLIVGLCTAQTVITVGMGIFIFASGLAILRSLKVVFKKDINKRSPEYKAAFVNLIIMGVIFLLSIFGLIYSIIY